MPRPIVVPAVPGSAVPGRIRKGGAKLNVLHLSGRRGKGPARRSRGTVALPRRSPHGVKHPVTGKGHCHEDIPERGRIGDGSLLHGRGTPENGAEMNEVPEILHVNPVGRSARAKATAVGPVHEPEQRIDSQKDLSFGFQD